MCVIICVEDGEYPSKKTLKNAESVNNDGGSIAWLNKDGTKSYKKGIKSKEIHSIINKKLIPQGIETAIIHFRIASIGSVKKKLCHPFEISGKVELNTEHMNTTRDLLFHNGTWSEYEEVLIEYLKSVKTPQLIPRGEYSDSRIMAFLASKMGYKAMAKQVKGWNKVAILTDKGIKRFGNNWCDVKNNKCSNNYFVPVKYTAVKNGYLGDTYVNGWNTGFGKAPDILGYLTEDELLEMSNLMDRFELSETEIGYMLSDGTSIYDLEQRLEMEESMSLKNYSIEDGINYLNDDYGRKHN
jgi:predicted glutamine amidotransferase